MRWHATYPIHHRGCRCNGVFRAKPQHQLQNYDIHPGKLRYWLGDVIHADVIVFKSDSEPQARKFSLELRFVQNVIEQLPPELRRRLFVAETLTGRVDTVEYLPGQKKTVRKEDIVVIQERVTGQGQVVDYDESHPDVSQFRHEHPILVTLMETIEKYSRGRRVVCCLRAVLAQEVYHLKSVTFRCCGAEEAGRRGAGQASRSSVSPHNDLSWGEGDCTDGRERLTPTAPVLQLEPTAPVLEDLPPPYWECVDMVHGPELEDLPPPCCECVDMVHGLTFCESCSYPPSAEG